MSKIRTALILGAGFGTRLRPLTSILPKPLLEVRGRPLILSIFDSLVDAGIKRLIVNTHHLAGRYLEFFEKFRDGDGRIIYRGVPVSISHEPEILDTGGAIKNILPIIGDEDSILVYNGDIISQTDIPALLRSAESSTASAILCLRESGAIKNVSVEGTKVRDMRFILRANFEKSAQFTGIFAAKKSFLEAVKSRSGKVFSTIDVLIDLLKKNPDSIDAHFDGSPWEDIGTLDSYKELNRGFDTNIQLIDALARDADMRIDNPIPIKKGASDRFFYTAKAKGGEDVVACVYSLQKAENSLYVPLANFLISEGFPVPKIYAHNADAGIILMQGLGSKDLLSISSKERLVYYKKAAKYIRLLHGQITDSFKSLKNPVRLSEPFGTNLYDWEHRYFFGECVRDKFSLKVSPPADELKFIKDTLSATPQCLLHRDLQSQNIMVVGDDVYFIDFQGMRFGCPFYDLASLLFDPYARLSSTERKSVLDAYFGDSTASEKQMEENTFLLNIGAAQRLMQALGAYGFLSLKKGKKEYSQYFYPALMSLSECAHSAGLRCIANTADACIEILSRGESRQI